MTTYLIGYLYRYPIENHDHTVTMMHHHQMDCENYPTYKEIKESLKKFTNNPKFELELISVSIMPK